MPAALATAMGWFGFALLLAVGLLAGNALMLLMLGSMLFPRATNEAMSRIDRWPWRRIWLGVAAYVLACAVIVSILATWFGQSI